MKHIWMLNHYAAEPGGVGGTRHYHLAEGLRSHGWTTTIIAGSVELNSGMQRLDSSEPFRLQQFGETQFLWINVPSYRGNGGGRMVNMLNYAFKAVAPRYTRDVDRPDVIVGSSVHLFAAAAGAILARRFRIPFVFEVRDLWPQTLIDFGRLKPYSPIATAMRCMERWLYRRADRIVVLLPRAGDYIQRYGIDSAKIHWIPNGVDLGLFPPPPERVRSSAEPFTIMYFGAHGQANALDHLIDAIALVSKRRPPGSFVLRMIGNGALKPSLMERAHALGLDSVISFEDPVPKNRIPSVAAEADAFVLSVLDKPELYRYGISMNKLFDYMASARPIIMASAAINNPVLESGCGLSLAPGDPEAIANAIEALMDLPETKMREMGMKGREFVEANYSFDLLSEKFAKVLEDCIDTYGEGYDR